MNNKKTIGIIILLSLILFSLSGCNENNTDNKVNEQRPLASVSVNDAPSTENNSNQNTNEKPSNVLKNNVYINARFAYRIEYPKGWTDIEESQTQDGALIYHKDDNDIRTFCEKAQDGYITLERKKYKSEGKNVEDFYTADGVRGIIVTGDEENKKLTHVIVLQNGNHYDFYALVKPDFYKNNENNILAMAKSIKILS